MSQKPSPAARRAQSERDKAAREKKKMDTKALDAETVTAKKEKPSAALPRRQTRPEGLPLQTYANVAASPPSPIDVLLESKKTTISSPVTTSSPGRVMTNVQPESQRPTTSLPVTTSSPGKVVTNVQLASKTPTTSSTVISRCIFSPKSPRAIDDIVGWEVLFHGLTDFPYLNGERGYVSDIAGVLLRVKVDPAKAASMEGCPALLHCLPNNLIAIRKGNNPFKAKKGNTGDAAALEASLAALIT